MKLGLRAFPGLPEDRLRGLRMDGEPDPGPTRNRRNAGRDVRRAPRYGPVIVRIGALQVRAAATGVLLRGLRAQRNLLEVLR